MFYCLLLFYACYYCIWHLVMLNALRVDQWDAASMSGAQQRRERSRRRLLARSGQRTCRRVSCSRSWRARHHRPNHSAGRKPWNSNFMFHPGSSSQRTQWICLIIIYVYIIVIFVVYGWSLPLWLWRCGAMALYLCCSVALYLCCSPWLCGSVGSRGSVDL